MKQKNKILKKNILHFDAICIDESCDTKNVTYLTFELVEKVYGKVIGYVSLYILDIKKDSFVNIKKYAMENTEDLLMFINTLDNSYGKKIFLEKIYIKESYQNKGYGKSFFETHIPKISFKYKVNEVYIHPAPIISGEKNRHEGQLRLVEFYEKIGFLLLNSNFNNIIMKKDIKSTLQ